MPRTYHGYSIVRGAYQGTTDDRLDRWYVQHPTDTAIDRRGPGYATIAEAKRAIDEQLRLRGSK